MGKNFLNNIKTWPVFVVVMFLIMSGIVIAWQKYPSGVSKYKTISLGMQAAEGPGSHTIWAPPYDEVWEESKFFVYSLGDNRMCVRSDCGIGGYFVGCLGGWISGYKIITDEFDYGLREAGVDVKKIKIITIADKNAKVVGIYPDASIRNLPHIMRNHRDLVSKETFEGCSGLLPSRWK